MNFFLVGGAVRDTLLGREVKDRDFVVVGGTAQQLTNAGFECVGQGFPVFLHPETGEEYALARREKKVGAGYTGFEFETGTDVTLEEDLSRRDLTINSMAMEGDRLIDPFNGRRDLQFRILRHTSAAFAEDPLRVVRLARFYARYSALNFTVAASTMTLAAQMVDRGDLNELPDERFWRELEKAFDDEHPEKFFELLFEIGALDGVSFFQNLFGGVGNGSMTNILNVAREVRKLPKEDRVDVFAALMAPLSVSNFFDSARAGNMFVALREVRLLPVRHDATQVQALLTKCRAWSTENRQAEDLLLAMRVQEAAASSWVFPIRSGTLREALLNARTVTSEPFQHLQGRAIGEAMSAARVSKIAEVLRT